MKRWILLLAGLLPALWLPAQDKPWDVKEITLSNGMQVWLNEDHARPVVYGAVVVRAGAKDTPGTGIAHYLEHMLFKGTTELGTTDYEAEKVWLDSIEVCYDRLAATADAAERKAIQQEINRLNIKAAEYAIPNEFDRLTAEIGGTGLNAATSQDYTFYYNSFSPQFIAQWAELNSHRLLHPVFRLFQSELETVYEEKNRADDDPDDVALEELGRQFTAGTPYAYDVLGTTESLKNPRLGEMKAFYEKYYVGCNMGLVLAGDFDAATVTPLLERTFGRIPRGEKPERSVIEAPVIDGTPEIEIKYSFPLKLAVHAFNGPNQTSPDSPAFDLAIALLTNNFSTGLLDSLYTSHKVLFAGAERVLDYRELGAWGFAAGVLPPFGSLSRAERLCQEQVDKVKRGEFSDNELETLKLEEIRQRLYRLETLNTRTRTMVLAMADGRSWKECMAEIDILRGLTREDVVRVAEKYFTDNYIRFKKVRGSYPKDKIAKPGYDPIPPVNAGKKSDYARRVEAMPAEELAPRLLDFENDVERVRINDHVTLYYKQLLADDLFKFQIRFLEGDMDDRLLHYVAPYVATLGTDSLTFQQLSRAWQQQGTYFSVDCSGLVFSLGLTGFDRNFASSLGLLRHVTDKLKADGKSFRKLKKENRVERKSFLKSGTSSYMSAVWRRVLLGEYAESLRRLTDQELAQAGKDGMVQRFRTLMDSDCALFYSGSLPKEEVVRAVREQLDLERCQRPLSALVVKRMEYDSPRVFFYDLPKSRQTMIFTMQNPAAPVDGEEEACLKVLGDYVGGGMYSLMFQEVREFRSMAYSTQAGSGKPDPTNEGEKSIFFTVLGTQADKTLQAMHLMDSLLRNLPIDEARLGASVRNTLSRINNDYPEARDVAKEIFGYENLGYREDPNRKILDNLDAVTPERLRRYYEEVVRPAPMSYIIIGDRKALPMDEIAKFGPIVELKLEDIYR